MRILTLLSATFGVVFLAAGEVCGQAGRYIPLPRPSVPPRGGGVHPVHVPVHLSKDSGGGDLFWAILAILAVVVLLVIGWKLGQAIARGRAKAPRKTAPAAPAGLTFSGPYSQPRQDPYQLSPAPELWKFSVPPPPFSREDHHRAQPRPAPSTFPVPPLEDLILSAEEVEEKALSTLWLLDELAQRNPLFNPSSLEAFIKATFLQVQQCWEKRDYGPVRDLLAPSLLAEHEELLQAMRRDGLINRIESLSVRRLEFVHVFCPEETDRHEVTALITFDARTYFVGEATGAYVHGSRKILVYQEYWVFGRRGDTWRLRTIDRDQRDHRGLRASARG
jgi:hypothetical protein